MCLAIWSCDFHARTRAPAKPLATRGFAPSTPFPSAIAEKAFAHNRDWMCARCMVYPQSPLHHIKYASSGYPMQVSTHSTSALWSTSLLSSPFREFRSLSSDVHKAHPLFKALEWIGSTFSFNLSSPGAPADGF